MGIKHGIGDGNGRKWETTSMEMGIRLVSRILGLLYGFFLFQFFFSSFPVIVISFHFSFSVLGLLSLP